MGILPLGASLTRPVAQSHVTSTALSMRRTALVYRSRRSLSSSSVAAKQLKTSPVIFTGIQPTGVPHLGNYLGMFLPFLDLQRSSPATTAIYLSVVGLHAITSPQDPLLLAQSRRDMIAALLACGVDPERTCLFLQEEVPEHTELAWHLNALTSVGRLQRMTTWKSRLSLNQEGGTIDPEADGNLKLGLLAYPVLQAADILLYKSTLVPVGEDQLQHLELTRDIATSFNRQFGLTFPMPEISIVPSKRILSLRNPSQKMSKSAVDASSRISIIDSPDVIVAKIKGAVTDSGTGISFDASARPGLANLLLIWSSLDDQGRSPEQLALETSTWGTARLKGEIAATIIERLRSIRDEYLRIQADPGWIRSVVMKGRSRAREQATRTMEEVRGLVGLRYM